jgi:hypothetical protein
MGGNSIMSLEYLTDGSRHLICLPYSIENLHRMAKDLGIKRCWFHNCRWKHYDIPQFMLEAVTAKCKVVTSKELLKIIRNATDE